MTAATSRHAGMLRNSAAIIAVLGLLCGSGGVQGQQQNEGECEEELDPLAGYEMDGSMAIITASSFDQYIKDDVCLLIFNQPECEPCSQHRATFESLADALYRAEPPIRVGTVDAGLAGNKPLIDALQIDSYPTLKWFWRGRPYPYDGVFELGPMLQQFQTRAAIGRDRGDPSVIRLRDHSFNDTASETPLMLVEFFAPWCGHCKRFAPEFETAGEELREEKVTLAEVDATVSVELAKRFNVTTFPALKLFRNGVPYDVPKMRRSEAIVSYITDHLRPPWVEVKDAAEIAGLGLAAGIEGKTFSDRIVLFCLSLKHKEDEQLLKTVRHVAFALRDHVRFALSFEEQICDPISPQESVSIVLDQRFMNPYEMAVQSADIGSFNITDTDLRFANNHKVGRAMEIEAWVRERLPPLVGLLNSDNYDIDWKQKRPLMIAFVDGNHGEDFALDGSSLRHRRDQILPVADKFKEFMFSAMAEPNDTDGLLAEFGLLKDMKDIAVAIYAKDGSKHVMQVDPATFDVHKLDAWVSDFFYGKTVPYAKSEPVPPASEQSAAVVVVGQTFGQIVLDPAADVLIMLYSPSCPHCQQLLPVYQQLAEALDKHGASGVVVAKMDATANDAAPGYRLFSYPTIYLAPRADKNSPVLYAKMVRAVPDFIAFIHEHGEVDLPASLLALTNAEFAPTVGSAQV